MKVLAKTENMTQDEWLAMRKRGIGGSDAAAALGLSPWKSPVQLYAEKTGEIDTPPMTSEAVYWGTKLESVVADRFAELNPDVKVEPVKAILVHPEHTFMIANLDREITLPDGSKGVLEIKTANARQADKWEDDNVPVNYTLQVNHYLAVTGYQFAWIACLLGGQQYVQRYIERDDELINDMTKKESEFWACVVNRTPPAWDGSEAAFELLKSLYPKAEPGKKVILPKELEPTLDQYLELDKRYKEYDAILKEVGKGRDKFKQELLGAMGDAELGVLGNYQLKYSTVERKEYVSPATSYRKFSLKGLEAA